MSGRARTLALFVALLSGGCNETGPLDVTLPAVVFVSGAPQEGELYLWSADTLTRLTSNDFADEEPHVAAGRLVFTSDREGNPEVYFGDIRATEVRRLTTHTATDGEPALHPRGDRIAFVSMRSGTPRLWTMDTLGGSLEPLATGSATFYPERAPTWSPQGDRIAFTSARTGTSQVFIVDATGGLAVQGLAVQLTSEAGGAFDPSWTPSGTHIVYATSAGTPRLRSVAVNGGEATDFAVLPDTALGEPSCGVHYCVAVRGAYGGEGDLVAYAAPRGSSSGGVPPIPSPAQTRGARVLLAREANDRHPAVVP
jgi:dipeptidyl aminopeptidase/acylaminoacyl peptidase